MELKIDRGLKSYEVTDADGTQLGMIYINPADVGIAARLEEARNAIQNLADGDRKSTRLNSSHRCTSRMPSSA